MPGETAWRDCRHSSRAALREPKASARGRPMGGDAPRIDAGHSMLCPYEEKPCRHSSRAVRREGSADVFACGFGGHNEKPKRRPEASATRTEAAGSRSADGRQCAKDRCRAQHAVPLRRKTLAPRERGDRRGILRLRAPARPRLLREHAKSKTPGALRSG